MKTNILGKQGLTVTSANHLANIAKEMYESIESRLAGLKFSSRDFLLAVNGNVFRIENESDKGELAGLSDDLKTVGELKSLIAFLREAIKAKEKLSGESEFTSHIDELIAEGRTDLKRPEGAKEVTFEDEFEKLTAEQKARYYALEAKCATLGGYIHPEGAFSRARKDYFEHKKNPTEVKGKGQEAEIHSFSSSFTDSEVDGAFFELQKLYRNAQAEFNKMKAELDEKVAEANKVGAEEAKNAFAQWVLAHRAERVKWNEEVKALKVVIPENLKEIYGKVNKVAADK